MRERQSARRIRACGGGSRRRRLPAHREQVLGVARWGDRPAAGRFDPRTTVLDDAAAARVDPALVGVRAGHDDMEVGRSAFVRAEEPVRIPYFQSELARVVRIADRSSRLAGLLGDEAAAHRLEGSNGTGLQGQANGGDKGGAHRGSRRGESSLHGLAPSPRGRWGHRLGRYGITTTKQGAGAFSDSPVGGARFSTGGRIFR